MRKENPARFSSAVGEAWMHCMFKVKYCHKLFDDGLYREGMRALCWKQLTIMKFQLEKLDLMITHVHFLADIGLYNRPEVAKLLRGYTAKKFFEFFPEAKKKYFWDSGFWNPSYFIGSPRDLNATINYIKKQKYMVREMVK